MSENIENQVIKKTRPKKTLDEKIEESKLKLKNLEELKRQAIQRKGRNIWKKIKCLFLEDEDILEELLNDKEKIEVLKNDIEDSLNKIFPKKEEIIDEKE